MDLPVELHSSIVDLLLDIRSTSDEHSTIVIIIIFIVLIVEGDMLYGGYTSGLGFHLDGLGVLGR